MAYNTDFSYRFEDDDTLESSGVDGGFSFMNTPGIAPGEPNPNAPNVQTATRGAVPGAPAPAPPATTQTATGGNDPQAARDQVAGWYNQHLGRTGTTDEYDAHIPTDGSLPGSEREGVIRNSPEGRSYGAVQKFQSQVSQINQTSDPSQRAQLRDKLARDLFSSLQQQGFDVKWQGEQLNINGRLYDLAGAEGATSSPAASSSSTPWAPVDNLEDLSFDQAYQHARPYDFNDFDSLGPTDQATEDLVMSILQNPESMSPGMVGTLKARSKDELAEMQQSRDEDLVGQRFALGYEDDSPFFRSERNDALRDYDRALVGSNREIDIGAAETNMADRRAAAGTGQSYVGQRMARQQSRESNRQAAASSRQNATGVAGNLALGRANLLTGDRQFNADYLLRRLGLEHGIDQDMWERFMTQFALGG